MAEWNFSALLNVTGSLQLLANATYEAGVNTTCLPTVMYEDVLSFNKYAEALIDEPVALYKPNMFQTS